MTERTELKPDWPWASNFSIAQGVKVGDEVFVSGQVALDRDGNVVGAGDMKAQTRQTFENIRTVLAEAGATMDDVVKILAFITDMSKYPDYAAVRAEVFQGNLPASSSVATPGLVDPNLLVEVEAVARIGSGG